MLYDEVANLYTERNMPAGMSVGDSIVWTSRRGTPQRGEVTGFSSSGDIGIKTPQGRQHFIAQDQLLTPESHSPYGRRGYGVGGPRGGDGGYGGYGGYGGRAHGKYRMYKGIVHGGGLGALGGAALSPILGPAAVGVGAVGGALLGGGSAAMEQLHYRAPILSSLLPGVVAAVAGGALYKAGQKSVT